MIVVVGLDFNVEFVSVVGFEVDLIFGGYYVNFELEVKFNIWVVRINWNFGLYVFFYDCNFVFIFISVSYFYFLISFCFLLNILL